MGQIGYTQNLSYEDWRKDPVRSAVREGGTREKISDVSAANEQPVGQYDPTPYNDCIMLVFFFVIASVPVLVASF